MPLHRKLSLILRQSGPQDQKRVIFSHSVISLNKCLQNSKNTAYIFLTFRNHVKIFLSQNIMQTFLRVVYRKLSRTSLGNVLLKKKRFSADGQNIAQNCTTMRVVETMLYWTAASPRKKICNQSSVRKLRLQ